ncbi:MAG: translational GTPase TypA [Patescibacteria group bacterium]
MNIRNIAIIAHVDHGKTTLVDALLRQSNTKLAKEVADSTCIMDSNELEKERGITIFSKNASVFWKDVKLNIIDTPGHADFGGEVERVLSMTDGALLLVDAKEGPMPQTRFVLKKALEMKLKIIVVINKVDKSDARPAVVVEKVLELFLELGAGESALDVPFVYAVAREGKAGLTPDIPSMNGIAPIFDAILEHIPAPTGDASKPLQMLVSSIVGDNFKGRIAIGRIYNGVIHAAEQVMHINRSGEMKPYRLTSLMTFSGLDRLEAKEASAGDIVSIAGIPDITIGETIADLATPVALPLLDIEEPTVKMTFKINDSPFAGKEGTYSTSRQIRARLMKELETDMALRVEDGPDNTWVVAGRGELHLAIVIERLRRDGFEFAVSRPQVIVKEVNEVKMVPYEKAYIEVPDQFAGAVIQKLGSRQGEMAEMRSENGITFLEFIIPTRGLFGYRSDLLTDSKGLGIINTSFLEYRPERGGFPERANGSLVAFETGETRLFGLLAVQDRGVLFIGPAVQVYKGQVVGKNSRVEDLPVNVCKEKQLSNMRSKGDGPAENHVPPKIMNLEEALEYIGDDELVEVTPKSVRIRKMVLDENEARRKARGM